MENTGNFILARMSGQSGYVALNNVGDMVVGGWAD